MHNKTSCPAQRQGFKESKQHVTDCIIDYRSSLETFRVGLDGALSNLVQLKMSLLMAEHPRCFRASSKCHAFTLLG